VILGDWRRVFGGGRERIGDLVDGIVRYLDYSGVIPGGCDHDLEIHLEIGIGTEVETQYQNLWPRNTWGNRSGALA